MWKSLVHMKEEIDFDLIFFLTSIRHYGCFLFTKQPCLYLPDCLFFKSQTILVTYQTSGKNHQIPKKKKIKFMVSNELNHKIKKHMIIWSNYNTHSINIKNYDQLHHIICMMGSIVLYKVWSIIGSNNKLHLISIKNHDQSHHDQMYI